LREPWNFRMRIECPRCSAAYDVPERLLTGRKSLRCARCGTEWTAGLAAAPPGELPLPEQAPPVELNESPAPEEAPPRVRPPRTMSLDRPSPTAMQRLINIAEPPPRSSLWPAAAWTASILVLALLLWAAFAWRTDIMQAWPPSTRVYAALGLTQPPR
jgi:predicted Zn finger-like uncharacterized protein